MSEEDLLDGVHGGDCLISEEDEKALLDTKDDAADEIDDLYDAAIEPSGIVEKRESVDVPPGSTPTSIAYESSAKSTTPSTATSGAHLPTPAVTSSQSSSGSARRFQCYIGNMTWWTTDKDIIKMLSTIGITDCIEIKFAENRQNGQSRGFATLVVGSEASVNTFLERGANCRLHNNAPQALPFNKQSLAKLEEANKGSASGEKKEDKTIPNLGTVRIGPPMGMNMMVRPPIGAMNGMNMPYGAPPINQMPQSLMNMRTMPPLMQTPLMPLGSMNRPPPSFGGPPNAAHSNMNAAQTMNSLLRGHSPHTSANVAQPLIPPGTHVNPQVYPYFAQQPKMDANRMGGGGGGGSSGSGDMLPVEYDEIMNRNRTVFNSAISRAMSDAAAGNANSAIETLQTAMTLIRQSKVGSSDACKTLLSTLQETLTGIDNKHHERGSSSRKHRRRSRSPSERGNRKYQRRSSRSRSRDRYDHSPRQSRRY